MNPRVKVIVVTGHTIDEVEDMFRGLGYYAFFEKGTLSLPRYILPLSLRGPDPAAQ